MPTVNDVGEPGAREPHARFDGGREETGDPPGPGRTVLAPPAYPTILSRQRRHHLQAVVGERPQRLAASRKGTTSLDQRQARDGQGVRVARYGEAPSESSFEREPSQTHSLEGGADDLLSCPQPV